MLEQINQYFNNYRILISFCTIFYKFGELWRPFYRERDKDFHLWTDCDKIIILLEEKLLEGDITENQKLYNIIDIKINDVEMVIHTFEVVLENEMIKNMSLNFILHEPICAKLATFCLINNQFIGSTIGDTYYFIKNKFEEDKEKIKLLFSLKTLPVKDFNLDGFLKRTEPIAQVETKVKTKIKWTGTPAEFGAIFNKLIDNGYIEKGKDLAGLVRVLSESFEIKNEKSEPVNPKYLYKCFGEKEKEYPNGYLKIPLSDNYHMGK